MSQVMITIGRNIGKTPMSDSDWSNFQAEIKLLFSDLYVDALYEGSWDNVKEMSNLYVGVIYDNVMPELEHRLSVIASNYSQDAIGLIVNSRADSLVYKAA